MLIITATLSGATRHEAKTFPATHESVTLENEAADRAGLKRYLSADEVARDVAIGQLVPIAWVSVSPKLPRERRYLRPVAADFVGWLEFEFYYETGKHLDVKNVTLCASSRFVGGYVPYVYRYLDGYVNVDRFDTQYRFDGLRARRAVR